MRLDKPGPRSFDDREAELFIVMAGVVGDPIYVREQFVDLVGPDLRGRIGEAAMSDLCRGAQPREAMAVALSLKSLRATRIHIPILIAVIAKCPLGNDGDSALIAPAPIPFEIISMGTSLPLSP